ncbi:MAG TPA: DUF1015 domain-containing protein [Actinomycetota bacterium]|jgi:uncharacterized protein (DUF1015 family)|nr:DUF1015 domain-containing protein [Actinomycetota bacterium]
MPELQPFRGIRYKRSDQLADIVCPPYDVISQEDQQRLHARHPHNAVHLELTHKGDHREPYELVASRFEQWLSSGVLQQDPEPGFYVYRQDFILGGQSHSVMGVIGALGLEEAGTGVLPHERTMPGPVTDRLELMRACPVNVSPIYAIYRGGGALRPLYEKLLAEAPDVHFRDDARILHRLWRVLDAARVDEISSALAPGLLVIADGHHRFETALAFHREMEGKPGGHGAVMCFCVDASSEDLVVLPYHRALKADVAPREVAERIKDAYSVSELGSGDLSAALTESGADHPFVFLVDGSSLLVEVPAEAVRAKIGDRPSAWAALDVVALHEAVLPEVLGPGACREMRFSTDALEVARLVDEGWTAGVLLRPVHPVDVIEVARSGERMPEKASYFWPKAVTGLVFRLLR